MKNKLTTDEKKIAISLPKWLIRDWRLALCVSLLILAGLIDQCGAGKLAVSVYWAAGVTMLWAIGHRMFTLINDGDDL